MIDKLGSFVADGLSFRVDVAFDAGSTVTNLTGAMVEASAQMLLGGVAVIGSATIIGPMQIEVVFAPWVLPIGTGIVQVRAIPPGHSGQTVLSKTFTMDKSIGA